MDWQKLSIPDFLTWLSIEGLDAADIIAKNYDTLPLPHRIALWHLVDDQDRDLLFPPHWHLDRDQSFRITLTASRPRPSPLRNKVSEWLYQELPGDIFNHASDPSAEKIQQIFSLDQSTLADLELSFAAYKSPSPLPPEPSRTEAEWDDLWEKDDSPGRILWLIRSEIPIACIDRWRRDPGQNLDVLGHALLNSEITVPPHWLPEITQNLALLSTFLDRSDAPMSIRLPLRSHPDKNVLRSAWSEGPISDEELEQITPNTPNAQDIWEAIEHNRSAVTPALAAKLLIHAPQSTTRWSLAVDLSDTLRKMAVSAGHQIHWESCQSKEILQLGLAQGKGILRNMTHAVRRSWGPDILLQLAERVLSTGTHVTAWDLRRIFHLGSITPSKSLLKSMISHPSKPIRLLAANILSSPAPSIKAAGPSR